MTVATTTEGAEIDRDALTCRELVALVTGYLEATLSSEDHERVESHLVRCVGCRRHLQQIQLTISAARRLSEEDLPPELRNRLLGAFRDWKREEVGG